MLLELNCSLPLKAEGQLRKGSEHHTALADARALGAHLSSHFFFCFLGPHLQPVEVPRLGVQSELQLPVYTTATATPDPSHVFDPHQCSQHHSSQQHWILNPLSQARDQTCASAATPAAAIGFSTHCTTAGTPEVFLKG